MGGNTFPKKPKPDENRPIPNILKIMPISISENIADTTAPNILPTATTIKNRNANDNRNFEDDIPKLL